MSLGPRVPPQFGPYRRAALEESQAGWCACCDARPIPNWKPTSHRFTCGKPECVRAWTQLILLDRYVPKTNLRQRREDGEGAHQRKA